MASAWGFDVEKGSVWIGRWQEATSFQQVLEDVSSKIQVQQSGFELRLPGELEAMHEQKFESLRNQDTLVIIHRNNENVFEIDCTHVTESPRLFYVIRQRVPGMTVRELRQSLQDYFPTSRYGFMFEAIALTDSDGTLIPLETMVDALPTQLKAFRIYNPDSLKDLSTLNLPDMKTFLNSEPNDVQMQVYLEMQPWAPEEMLHATVEDEAFPSAVRAVQSLPDSERYAESIRQCMRLTRCLL